MERLLDLFKLCCVRSQVGTGFLSPPLRDRHSPDEIIALRTKLLQSPRKLIALRNGLLQLALNHGDALLCDVLDVLPYAVAELAEL
jgi:hypothetical protein